ncbi:MAG: ELM1/GtrOC1 family putative glycosyltransferase, partial [Hyphomicrobium sp.]
MVNTSDNLSDAGAERLGALAGRTAWIFSDGKAGHEIQCRGVAEALGLVATIKRIAEPGRLYKLTAPHGRPPRVAHFGKPGSDFAPPWPVIAFATGRLTTPYIRALKKRAGLATFTVILLDPKTGASSADLFWVPEHDRRRGANVITTLTSPHGFSLQRLVELRRDVPADIATLPHPRVAVMVGGPNGDYRYEDQD